MATVDLSLQRKQLLGHEALLNQLPPDLREIIRAHAAPNFLDAVAEAALIPQATGQLFIHFESVFADICARWLRRPRARGQEDHIIAAFARILPFAPHLEVFLELYIRETSYTHTPDSRPLMINSLASETTIPASENDLPLILLAFWRLLNFDKKTFCQLILPSRVQALFQHELAPVRFLAIKIFCCQLGVSDHKWEAMVRQHIRDDDEKPLVADFDGLQLDYTFLSLFEHKRAQELDELRLRLESAPVDISPTEHLPPQSLTDLVAQYGRTILPRPNGEPSSLSSLIRTPTTLANLESLAQKLQHPGPILLHGLPGSGKTSSVHELARELGMHSTMVTLHLNEQTDAKMLVGLYSTGSKPGSFAWRPGVLTTAVREGRWVLIEDLDRAPNEVMSTLLPLVEHGRLMIPSRGEQVEAPSSFRLFATVRSTRSMHGQESIPNLLGQRFWQVSGTMTPSHTELEQIIVGSYPRLHKHTPMIMSIFQRLSNLPQVLSLGGSSRGSTERPITPRDLLKWCRRLDGLLDASGCQTGDEPISETTRDWMFMEAIDCFCGGLSRPDSKAFLAGCIAELMHLPKQLMEHYLDVHVPKMETSPGDLKIGRVVLTRRRYANRVTKSRKPFANTSHARRLLEQISVAVKLREPVLLVGETGIGKTTVVQQLAETLGHKLVAVNLSQQSEVGDLLGGFKPVNARTLAVPLKEEFDDLFAATGISAAKNQEYLKKIERFTAKGQWTSLSRYLRQAPKMFNKILEDLQSKADARDGEAESGPAAKRRKTGSRLQSLLNLKSRWEDFDKSLDQFDVQTSGGKSGFAFAFVEGNIVKAARNGDWVLLDEINLASPDTLESIADLLASGPNDKPSILLSETGDIERVVADPNFRIFGAMNPATDVGKRDLPLGLRSRFTELFVGSPDKDLKDLLTIIKVYLSGKSAKDDQAADDVARLYLNTKQRAEEKRLVDGANEVPHFSLRTLTRVLTYVNDVSPYYGLRRALFEGFSMGFLTLLDRASEESLLPLIHHHLLDRYGSTKSLLSQPPKHPNDGRQYVKFKNKNKDRQYWLLQGQETPMERSDYIVTPYIERNLLNLVRATSTRRFPILIQGPTSAGKTSMIEYLANYSGNRFVRINNHEHTDLQEYLGTYVSDADGKLRFQEGLLVQALRQGHWIVLDELNLAPTDVLEALNRLLDDNRELLIPETQEVVRPHENFMLFATQNPPGLYGGRKVLSRAFRNRFLELHYDDIPEDELETILQKRSLHTAPSDCRRIVNVYKELSRLRQTSRLFENKDSFATLRDLFRWAMRGADTREEIAANGFMLLAERVRDEDERLAVKKVIENIFKVKVDQHQLYDLKKSPYLRQQPPDNNHGVVWTHAMRRLYVLVASALRHNEPVLLVGDTGCGKTTVCQLLAESLGKELHIVNAHQNTETGDLIGSQRPIRNRGAVTDTLTQDLTRVLSSLQVTMSDNLEDLLRDYHALDTSTMSQVPVDVQQRIAENEVKSKALFEWSDGSLVQAMREGQHFLLDEISLADDSVLERLNSVLEPQRTLLLAEKGIEDSFVRATDGFQFLATMNPGGDFGKKELSPALRNRFTEIWVPPLSENEDVLHIVSSKLRQEFQHFASVVVEFSYWFGQTFRSTASAAFSIRDILVWVKFINESKSQEAATSVVHGAATVFIDTLGANPSALIATDSETMDAQRQNCLDKLSQLLGLDATPIYRAPLELVVTHSELKLGDFSIKRASSDNFETGFALHAPTTKLNAMRVIRALQVQKPILLEGSPGVGKTTLVSALARACGQPLTRINLSDQTDLMDLFGTDVPVEGAEAGHFAWRDAPFLRAMQNGEWVLLDEMNLASQSVLEGLNACLDHRGEVYVSELDQVFKKHPDFRLFAAQNPHHQGGGRKGLPSSFVNRFIVVYADVFSEEDLLLIARHNFPSVSSDTVRRMIQFISTLERRIIVECNFGSQGSPWEFNLRDTLRWLHLLASEDPLLATGIVDDFLGIVIRQRFRNENDRAKVDNLFAQAFESSPRCHQLYHDITPSSFQVGLALMPRNQLFQPSRLPGMDTVPRLSVIESLLICVKQNIPSILVGPSGAGKSMLLQHIAALAGQSLVTFPLNADIDTMDLVGGFEQSDPLRELNVAIKALQRALQLSTMEALPQALPAPAADLLSALGSIGQQPSHNQRLLGLVSDLQSLVSMDSELSLALLRVHELLQRPAGITNPRFEWLDGIIVQAVQQGQWLVLDNANLCSASVLDRLNSLLEPDGFLIINEHCGPNGEPRVVKPHPNFRVFLTVDPRYGELSRAMRNRAVEIYVEPRPVTSTTWLSRVADIEPHLQRFKGMMAAIAHDAAHDTRISPLAAEDMSFADLGLFQRHDRSHSSLRYAMADKLAAPSASRIKPSVPRDIYLQVRDLILAPCTNEMQSAICQLGASLTIQGRVIDYAIPLHPLQNSVIVPLLQGYSSQLPFWLATCYETHNDVLRARKALESQQSRNVQVSGLNRLQRSCIADRVAAVARDTTVDAAKFLAGVLQAVEGYIQSQLHSPGSWKQHKYLLRALLHCWWRTFAYLVCMPFQEAEFQAHLSHTSDEFAKMLPLLQDPNAHGLLKHVIGGFEQCFVHGFKLTSGLSMKEFWEVLRPIPVDDGLLLQQLSQMEQLASQFDQVKWRSTAAPRELATAMDSIVKAYRLVRLGEANIETLLKALNPEIQQLERQLVEEAKTTTPFFATEFELIRQIVTLNSMKRQAASPGTSSDLILLSNQPLVDQLRIGSATATSWPLQSVENLFGANGLPQWDASLSLKILTKLDSIGSASLSSLALLETELPALAQQLGAHSESVTGDRLDKLSGVLWHLMQSMVGILDPMMGAIFTAAREDGSSVSVTFNEQGLSFNHDNFLSKSLAPHVSKAPAVVKEFLVPAFISWMASNQDRSNRIIYLANAWVQFSVAMVAMFVPDKAYDPQLRPQVELRSYEELLSKLKQQLQSLQDYGVFRTGQSTNLRCELLEEDIKALGELPTGIKTVYRPLKSELPEIQGEFNSILKIVGDSNVSSVLFQHYLGSDIATQQLHVTRENISRISYRLASNRRFRAYEDIVVPTVNILHCMELGLSLCEGVTASSSASDGLSPQVLRLAPLLGGSLVHQAESLAGAPSSELLAYAGVVVSVEGASGLMTVKQRVFEAVHALYGQWSQKLEADKKNQEARNRSYRYRGGLDDEEAAEQEAFNELFPSFVDDRPGDEIDGTQRIEDARALAIRLAKAHKAVFLEPQDPSESIKDLIKTVARRVMEGSTAPETDRNLLTATFLSLEEMLQDFGTTATPSAYNFYTDRHVPEARKLVGLVNELRLRFRQLQQVDEIGHLQPLAEVVSACDKILELSHTDPLAKIITRVEQLHASVYEWQFGGWASKVYSVLPSYTRLTDMLISWRRLELSTWHRLFDMESRKCDEDAQSWWFVAYQAIIAGPMAAAEAGEDVQSHAASLLKELETYFSSAPVGQFASRLKLLRQLHQQLTHIISDFPSMLVFRDSLKNFIDFHSRYERAVDDFIKAGKAPIEKQMKDVLLLASWKDTNIVALRESARKSHHKLFRIVRKFRDLLSRPMQSLIDQGLPDAACDGPSLDEDQKPPLSLSLDRDAIDTCRTNIQGWAKDYRRLDNSHRTIDVMSSLGRLPAATIDAGGAIDTFLADLNSHASELRKETPTVLSDDNKDLVKHLKSRKRKLFAETLKAMRQMGFQYNLSLDVLRQQDSLSTILASTAALSDHRLPELKATEYYFHKMIDLSPRVRGATQDHSDDLTGAEVARSIGFIDGILHASLQQRQELLAALRDFEALSSSQQCVTALVDARGEHGIRAEEPSPQPRRSCAWLVQVLKVGIQLVEVHAKFGSIDNGQVLLALNMWRERIDSLAVQWDKLPSLPKGLVCQGRLQAEEDVQSALSELGTNLDEMCQTRPDLAFILEQIQLWTVINKHTAYPSDATTLDLSDLTHMVKSLCDTMLVAVERTIRLPSPRFGLCIWGRSRKASRRLSTSWAKST
ncbi:P-loop containing nucleoside triphosphate hydrolase protein [Xylariaceae sp. FL0804]|nr:P-loop containing nucleoside triphosphate hydrolase protein [Xylariaceae sp. FL0804]